MTKDQKTIIVIDHDKCQDIDMVWHWFNMSKYEAETALERELILRISIYFVTVLVNLYNYSNTN